MPRLAPVVSELARQTIRTAFEELEQTVTPADAREMRSMTAIHQVRAAALEIESRLAARQTLRNMRRLAPLLTGLEHYAKVMDVLCNGTPFLSWIWSPITLILRVASEFIEAFEEIMRGYTKIADTLSRFGILSDAFITNPDFQHTLVIYYSDILQFHKHAYKFVRRSGWRLLFVTSWGRFQRRFDNIIDNLDRHAKLIDKEANAMNIAEAREMRQELRTWKEKSLDQVKRDEEDTMTKQYQSILAWLKIDEIDQLRIFESIVEEAKYPETCSWLLEKEQIKSWLRRNHETRLVWVQGKPGSGKSVMSARLVKFLHASKMPVVHHFCSYTYPSSTKYDGILKSLLLQILRNQGDLIAHVYRQYISSNASVNTISHERSPTISNLEGLICTLVAALSDQPRQPDVLWLIIDGANECEIMYQKRLITLLKQLSLTGNGTILKVLISARNTPILSKQLRKKLSLCLSNETTILTTAIRLYASRRMRSLQDRWQQLELEPEELEELEILIANKAEGMFLYARLVLDYISTNVFYSGKELKHSISQLPQSLADFYHKLLTPILSPQNPQSRERVRSVFSWIAFAKRPLKKLELQSALSFGSGDPNIEKPAPRYVIEDICGPLIEERHDTTLAFIHVTVKDFLQSSSSPVRLIEKDAVQEHGIATVTCLLAGVQAFHDMFPKQKRLFRLVKGVHCLHVYATEYWTEYILASASVEGGLQTSPLLSDLAQHLAWALEQMHGSQLTHSASASDEIDKRLSKLEEYPLLRKHIESALFARSQEGIVSNSVRNPRTNVTAPSQTTGVLDGISDMLAAYQKAVEAVLEYDSVPGVLADELDLFRSQFRASAYTCRFRSCPRATMGFDSDYLRRQHEVGHAGGFRCDFPNCQYPPFPSSQSLRSHVERCHIARPARQSIRRVPRSDLTEANIRSSVEAMRVKSTPRVNGSKPPEVKRKNDGSLAREDEHSLAPPFSFDPIDIPQASLNANTVARPGEPLSLDPTPTPESFQWSAMEMKAAQEQGVLTASSTSNQGTGPLEHSQVKRALDQLTTSSADNNVTKNPFFTETSNNPFARLPGSESTNYDLFAGLNSGMQSDSSRYAALRGSRQYDSAMNPSNSNPLPQQQIQQKNSKPQASASSPNIDSHGPFGNLGDDVNFDNLGPGFDDQTAPDDFDFDKLFGNPEEVDSSFENDSL